MNASIRMYRHGLGDCFLLGFPKLDGTTFWTMIDCGVVLGQADAETKMQSVANDIKLRTGGRVDLLIATHEHWDHVSGFVQAAEILDTIAFDAVWLAWTEDPANEKAKALAREHAKALDALRFAEARFRLSADVESADEIAGLVGLFGVDGEGTTADAFEKIRSRGKIRYCDPGDAPQRLSGTDVTAYVLGPPQNEELLKTLSLAPNGPEMYGLDASAYTLDGSAAPFGPMQAIPTSVAMAMPFFRERYWGNPAAARSDAPDWRRIDTAFLDGSAELALALDSYTNNTSLVVAFELPDGAVLLFPGDAQIGSWLSWKTLSWTVGERTVRGPDLLARATFYKVGHHGSHNATARASGLEMMTSLRVAMVPVDHAEAVKKHWDRMPLENLVQALATQTHGEVIRADAAPPAEVTSLAVEELFYEIAL